MILQGPVSKLIICSFDKISITVKGLCVVPAGGASPQQVMLVLMYTFSTFQAVDIILTSHHKTQETQEIEIHWSK